MQPLFNGPCQLNYLESLLKLTSLSQLLVNELLHHIWVYDFNLLAVWLGNAVGFRDALQLSHACY